MLDVEKFLVALRSNKDFDGKLKPIHLADTVQEEIKIIQAAVENSRRKWVGLTLNEAEDFYEKYTDRAELINAVDKFLEEKNS
jgi:hypothetical protein